jgi:putative tryptophan/tyrosine transport system substrate-binding protein
MFAIMNMKLRGCSLSVTSGKKSMIKKLIVLAGLSLFYSAHAYSQSVAVVSSKDVAFFEQAVAGMTNDLKKNGVAVTVVYTDEKDYLNKLKSGKYDVICTLGANISKDISDSFKTVPVVFSLVIDPVRSQIVTSVNPSGGNVTGLSLKVSTKEQLDLVRKVIPDVRKVGVFYTEARRDYYDDLSAIEGLTVKGVKVADPTQVPAGIKDFSSSNADIFWMGLDANVYSKDSLAYVLQYTSSNKIPTMIFSSNLVKAGALMGLTYDYDDLGRQTAAIIMEVIKGKAPGEIPVATPRKPGYALNVKVAEHVGLKLPKDVISAASEVY